MAVRRSGSSVSPTRSSRCRAAWARSTASSRSSRCARSASTRSRPPCWISDGYSAALLRACASMIDAVRDRYRRLSPLIDESTRTAALDAGSSAALGRRSSRADAAASRHSRRRGVEVVERRGVEALRRWRWGLSADADARSRGAQGAGRGPACLPGRRAATRSAPGLVDHHRDHVREVQAAHAGVPRQSRRSRGANRSSSAAGSSAVSEPNTKSVAGPETRPRSAIAGPTWSARSGGGPLGVDDAAPVAMQVHRGELVVVEPGAAHLGVVDREAERLDQVQRARRRSAHRRITLPVSAESRDQTATTLNIGRSCRPLVSVSVTQPLPAFRACMPRTRLTTRRAPAAFSASAAACSVAPLSSRRRPAPRSRRGAGMRAATAPGRRADEGAREIGLAGVERQRGLCPGWRSRRSRRDASGNRGAARPRRRWRATV